jgi:hypothetical protein
MNSVEGKNGMLIIMIIAVIAIAGAAIYFSNVSLKKPTAVLYLEQGAVSVNADKGWETASNQMQLYEGYSVRTSASGKATIVFSDATISRLEPGTEVKIQSLQAGQVSLAQASGQTWNKVEDISGIKSYKVTTPNAVALVKGTAFQISSSDLMVNEGIVGYTTSGGSYDAPAGKVFYIDNGRVMSRDMTSDEKKALRSQVISDIVTLKSAMIKIIHEEPEASSYFSGMSDMQIFDLLLNGKTEVNYSPSQFGLVLSNEEDQTVTLDKIVGKKTPAIERVLQITQKIRGYISKYGITNDELLAALRA